MLLHTGGETENEQVERRILSIAEDILFTATNGRIQPQKQILIGMGIKSMTGSKKVITILNRFGHSVNYNTVEEYETAIAADIA